MSTWCEIWQEIEYLSKNNVSGISRVNAITSYIFREQLRQLRETSEYYRVSSTDGCQCQTCQEIIRRRLKGNEEITSQKESFTS